MKEWDLFLISDLALHRSAALHAGLSAGPTPFTEFWYMFWLMGTLGEKRQHAKEMLTFF